MKSASLPFLFQKILSEERWGIFAQRAKHRHNPIGTTTVDIIAVQDGILTIKGLDAINGTPVFDIKPYFPIFDKVNGTIPEWVNELMKKYFYSDVV